MPSMSLKTFQKIDERLLAKARWLVLADLHLHHRPEYRFEWTGDFLEDLDNIALNAPPGLTLLLLGDALEVKDRVPASVLNDLLEMVLSWASSGREVIWLTGQHDSYLPHTATLCALDRVPNIIIVDDAPTHRGDVGLVPYSRDPAQYREWLGEVEEPYLFTHMPINEVLRTYSGSGEDDKWITLADFADFDKVYSGDIHNECAYDNVEYIGAVSQRDWRDAGVHGCVGLVTDDFKLHRLRTNHPMHVKATTRTELKRALKLDRVAIRVSGLSMTEQELNKIRDMENVIGVEWEPPTIEETVDVEDPEELDKLSPPERLREYLGGIDIPEDGLSDDFLLECGEDCLNED